jgi:hypothetical protein
MNENTCERVRERERERYGVEFILNYWREIIGEGD